MAKNTLTVYGRMILSVGLGLLATRILVARLGQSDFGILAALGASTTLLAVLSSAIATSSQRHFAVAIGRGDRQALRSYFSNAVVGFATVGVILFFFGCSAAPAVVKVFSLPAVRVDAAVCAFRWSMVSVGVLVVSAPYCSMITAHQRIGALAAIDLLQALLRLGAAAAVGVVPGDRLVCAAGGIAVASAVGAVATVAFSGATFCRWLPSLSDLKLKEILELVRFAGWTTFGQATWALQLQVAALVIAYFHGPVAASANALAQQIAAYLSSLAYAIAYVARPAIATVVGGGERQQARRLMFLATKATWLISCAFAVPVALESQYLLRRWVNVVPAECGVFVVLLLCGRVLYNATYNFDSGLIAEGTIAKYMVAVAGTYTIAIGVACSAFGAGAPAASLPAILVIAGLIHALGIQPFFLRRQIAVPAGMWLRGATLPGVTVMLAGLCGGVCAQLLAPAGVLRVSATCVATWAAATAAFWRVGIGAKERAWLRGWVEDGVARMRR